MNAVLLVKKSVLVVLIVAIGIAVFPVVGVSASELPGEGGPEDVQTQIPDERLEILWVRLQRIYDRQGRILDRSDAFIENFRSRLDEMEENGRDVDALRSALDNFADGIEDARVIYLTADPIINSHPGFDGEGNVTDHDQAVETLQDIGGKLKEVRDLVKEPGQALRNEVQSFRKSNTSSE